MYKNDQYELRTEITKIKKHGWRGIVSVVDKKLKIKRKMDVCVESISDLIDKYKR
jgi:hypothetical protein